MTEVLPYLQIFMTEELSETEIAELAAKQLEITTQYTRTPEQDALDNAEGDSEEGQDSNGEGQQGTQPDWMNYPIDQATGHRVDPVTGEHMDPDTGDPIGGNQEFIGSDVPTNPGIIDPQ